MLLFQLFWVFFLFQYPCKSLKMLGNKQMIFFCLISASPEFFHRVKGERYVPTILVRDYLNYNRSKCSMLGILFENIDDLIVYRLSSNLKSTYFAKNVNDYAYWSFLWFLHSGLIPERSNANTVPKPPTILLITWKLCTLMWKGKAEFGIVHNAITGVIRKLVFSTIWWRSTMIIPLVLYLFTSVMIVTSRLVSRASIKSTEDKYMVSERHYNNVNIRLKVSADFSTLRPSIFMVLIASF